MFKFDRTVASKLLTLILATALPLHASRAADIEEWLNAEGWELSYEVSFKSTSQGSAQSLFGPVTYTTTLDRAFSATSKLDLRSPGASLSMTKLTVEGGASSPEMQAALMDLVSQTDRITSWMNSGVQLDDNASPEAQQKVALAFMTATRGPAHLDYLMVETGVDLINETGTHFNQTTTTTRKGTGMVSPSGMIMFELNAESKRYLLTLPYVFRDDSMTTVKEETVVHQEMKGESPSDTRTSYEHGLDLFPSGLGFDDSTATVGDMPVMEGGVDPAGGKITGERTIKGHYSERGANVPGIFVFRYTLTPR